MDEETRLVAPPDGSVPSETETPAPGALTLAEEEAQKILAVIDRMAEHLQLQSPQPSKARRVRSGRTVPREFVVATIAAVDAVPSLKRRRFFDTARARQVLQDNDARRLIAERVTMFLKSLHYTMEAEWAEVVHDALTTYAMAGRDVTDMFNLEPEDADLPMHVENMGKHLGRRKRSKKEKPETE